MRASLPFAKHVAIFVTVLFIGSTVLGTRASADDPLGLFKTLDVTTTISASDPALTDPGTSDPSTDDPPHLSMGGPFKLFGSAKKDLDPQNPFNEVISFDTSCNSGLPFPSTGTAPSCGDAVTGQGGPVAGAFRKFGGHVKIGQLTNTVEVKYFFMGRTCAGDAPRVQLGIDANGDGTFDGNAFGHLGDKPFGGGCAMNMWVFEDMTNSVKKWDLSQFPGAGPFCGGNAMTCSWQDMVNFFNTVHPTHQVLNYVLVDDAAAFAPTSRGCVFFDVVSAGSRTLTSWRDVAGDGDKPNNC